MQKSPRSSLNSQNRNWCCRGSASALRALVLGSPGPPPRKSTMPCLFCCPCPTSLVQEFSLLTVQLNWPD